MSILAEISANLQAGKAKIVKELVQSAIDQGIAPGEILQEGLISGMDIIGVKFKNNEVFVPEVLISARAMNQGAELLKPLLKESGVKPIGKAVIGTVKGDLHDIGKNLVRMMLEGKGIEVIDLGVDVSADKFYESASAEGAKIVCCSALLTTTMVEMKNVVEKFKEMGNRGEFVIMVGGAPVNDSFKESIGADIYTADAASAAEAAKEALIA